jgi:hypothetical protein
MTGGAILEAIPHQTLAGKPPVAPGANNVPDEGDTSIGIGARRFGGLRGRLPQAEDGLHLVFLESSGRG